LENENGSALFEEKKSIYFTLTLGADNNFYGTTAQGGACGVGPGLPGWGTLFKLSP
jgi:uncharacterized repeat protein (TIGR03803 family)